MAWFFGLTTLALLVWMFFVQYDRWKAFIGSRKLFLDIEDNITAMAVSRHLFTSHFFKLARYSQFSNYILMNGSERADLNRSMMKMNEIFYSYFNNHTPVNGVSEHSIQEIKHLLWLAWRKNGFLSCNDRDEDKESFKPWWEEVALPLLRSGEPWWQISNQWPTNPNSDN